jgi:hypothetical protein
VTPLRTAVAAGASGYIGQHLRRALEPAGVRVRVDDVVRAILHLHAVPTIAGPVNVATPNPVTNAELMTAVRAAFGWSHGLPLPAGLLEFGARVIRTETELVLKSRWVHPGVLLDSRFEFSHPTLPEALTAIAAQTPRGLLPVALG